MSVYSKLLLELEKRNLIDLSMFEPLAKEEAYSRIRNGEEFSDFVERLQEILPLEFQNHEFFIRKTYPTDVHVAWGNQFPVCVQIDAEIGVLCASFGGEYGNWPDGIDLFMEEYRKQNKKQCS